MADIKDARISHGVRVRLAEEELKAALEEERNKDQSPLGRERADTGGMIVRPMETFDLDHLFSYHSPDPVDLNAYRMVRAAAKHFAWVILTTTSPGADQSAAIRKVREAVMTANASIALRGRL
jgi:hypothetical protein